MQKVRKKAQSFDVKLIRFFWLSYISGAIAIILSYIFSLGANRNSLIALVATIVIGIGIIVVSAIAPQKLKHLSKIVAFSNILLAVGCFFYLLNLHQVADLQVYHLQFSGLCLITPLLLFHLFIAFENQVGQRLSMIFYAAFLAIAALFLLGGSLHSNDTFIRSALVTLVFVSVAYIFIYSASFRLMRKEHEAKTKALVGFTYRDSVTKLANRTAYTKKLKTLCKVTIKQHQGHHYGLVLIDINGFKRINDHYGQHVGDRCLRLMGKRIQNALPKSSFIARTDGDEFNIIVPLKNITHLAEICETLSKDLNVVFDLETYQLSLPVSISACQYPRDGNESHVLLRKLDWAMNVAKGSKDAYTLYDTALGKRMTYQETIESELASAIENDEFELHYQAIMDLGANKVSGAEALLRWTNPKLGKVSPEDFIPIAEASGLIVPIGNWVLEEGCRQLRDWLDADFDINIAINISMAQFKQENFIDDIRILLAKNHVNPKRLELEVTESLAFDEVALHRLNELQQIGCTVKLDDFGTGYSSLSILKSLPLNELKIDKSFVQELDDAYDSQAWTMIQTIINLAHSFDLEVVAEGVETQTQLNHLQTLHCNFAQGYHISKPISADRFYQQFLFGSNKVSVTKSPTQTGYRAPNHSLKLN